MKKIFTIFLLVMLFLILFQVVKAAVPPDVIEKYTVILTPQKDGSLIIEYQFTNYCAKSDFPSNAGYLDIGVANRKYDLIDFGPGNFVKNGKPNGSTVRLEFFQVPQEGDCFDLNFTIRQRAVATLKDDEVQYQFKPGWFDFAQIRQLNVIFVIEEGLELTYTDPPVEQADKKVVWTAENLKENQSMMVAVKFDASFFDETQNDGVETADEDSESSVVAAIIIIVVILLVVFIVLWLVSQADDYDDGRWAGTPGSSVHRTLPSSYRPSSPPSTPRKSSPPSTPRTSSPPKTRTGGGGGSFGGRGSSCASSPSCVSCACACACAGGGRAGCSKNGLGVGISKRLRNQWRRLNDTDTET